MFFRLKTQKRQYGDLLTAYLVETRRIDKRPRQVIRDYLGSIRADDVGDCEKRLAFWNAIDRKCKQLKVRQTYKMRAALRNRVPPGYKVGDAWSTPLHVIEDGCRVIGSYGFDPCSSDYANQFVQAAHYFAPADDSLWQTWPRVRSIWMNPLYSEPWPWVEKLITHYKAGRVEEALILLHTRSMSNGWFIDYVKQYPHSTMKRLHFHHEYLTQKHSAPDGSVIVYIGNDAQRFKEVFP
jgi:phage N-6-adenine-methyltransferase